MARKKGNRTDQEVGRGGVIELTRQAVREHYPGKTEVRHSLLHNTKHMYPSNHQLQKRTIEFRRTFVRINGELRTVDLCRVHSLPGTQEGHGVQVANVYPVPVGLGAARSVFMDKNYKYDDVHAFLALKYRNAPDKQNENHA